MRSSMRRSSLAGSSAYRAGATRQYARVTKDDIRGAGLRRWDGNARITTDWVNLFHEPELSFADGDVLIYLREPGQSSRGPAFRVHKERLQSKGFGSILAKCIDRMPIVSKANCLMASCHGCDEVHPMSELYIPAPPNVDLDTVFDHHITTRNFLAWVYNVPLAGRALGVSLVALKERVDYYRPGTINRTTLDIISYAESQRYLDFRECADHALAALFFAEFLELEDLWVDAFAHCVGMGHRQLDLSIEYPAISDETQLALEQSHAEMEARLQYTIASIEHFFEHSLSSNVLGLSEAARDHFDRFRSWLHSHYIEQHGFWPPIGFDDDVVQRKLLATMYSDFRNLYQHLADPRSSSENISLAGSGGICALQNVRVFDETHRYAALPKPLPLIPTEPDTNARPLGLQRRKSWNPVTKRRIERERRNTMRAQALIKASNRDWQVMECLLVRRYSEFEVNSVVDESESISMVDGRKIRWLLVYAILQTLVSVMQAPKQVRNTDGLTYWLCCRTPDKMPWSVDVVGTPKPQRAKRESQIEPDIDHLKTSTQNNVEENVSVATKRGRRMSLPSRAPSTSLRTSLTSTATRSLSLRRLMSKRASHAPDVPQLPKAAPFCEILVQGYGNGLNETTAVFDPAPARSISNSSSNSTANHDETPKASNLDLGALINNADEALASPTSDHMPGLTPASSASVSRESSNASSKESAWSKSTTSGASTSGSRNGRVPKSTPSLQDLMATDRVKKPEYPLTSVAGDLAIDHSHQRVESKELNRIADERGLSRTAHINTDTWDRFLGIV